MHVYPLVINRSNDIQNINFCNHKPQPKLLWPIQKNPVRGLQLIPEKYKELFVL